VPPAQMADPKALALPPDVSAKECVTRSTIGQPMSSLLRFATADRLSAGCRAHRPRPCR